MLEPIYFTWGMEERPAASIPALAPPPSGHLGSHPHPHLR